MFYKISEDEYIILIKEGYSEAKFLRRTGLEKQSFAWNMLRHAYRTLTSELVDLFDEYLKYYSREYSSFEIFLYKKHNLEPEFIRELVAYFKKGWRIYLRAKYVTGDYTMEQLMYSDEMKERIIKLLKLG